MSPERTLALSCAALLVVATCGPRDNPTPQAPEERRISDPPPPSDPENPEAFAVHLDAVEERAPEGFTVVGQPPFVVVGDEDPSRVRARAAGVVAWTVRMLKQDFFDRDPEDIIDIWLFKDDTSYRRHARLLFGDDPDTPYGYYSASDRALVMNISTGGGTLVHEIVHPFMRANFPRCPAWFNEGLGSLYEQAAERDGHIVGLTNWRLAGLKEAIADGSVPSFEALASTTEAEFYDEDPGTNYAQARYLCLYLQEKGLLVGYYREFTANQSWDPTGFQTLKRVLGAEDMGRFKSEWESWVMTLAFP